MKHLLSCEFNFDTVCVELKFSDGTMIAIDTIAVENEIADNMYQRSELDYPIYNDPIAYADLILNGNLEAYLKAVTEYKMLDGEHKVSTDFSVGSLSLWVFTKKKNTR